MGVSDKVAVTDVGDSKKDLSLHRSRAPADAGVLRLGLKGQGKERGEGREEHDRQAARREGPYAQTPRPPRFGSLQSGIISAGINTRVELSVWLHFRSAEHRLRYFAGRRGPTPAPSPYRSPDFH